MFRGLARMLAVAVLSGLGLPGPAGAAPELLVASGSITYTWQGDRSRGCAAVGVCDVSGALIVQAAGSGSATRLFGETRLNLDDMAMTVRVLSGSGPTASTCVDVPGQAGGPGLFTPRGPGGRARPAFLAGLSSGRCAGPLAADLRRLGLPVRKTGGKFASFDLRTTRAYVAGPYSGRLVSTVRLRPDLTKPIISQSFGPGPAPTAPPGQKVLVERVTLRYRVHALPGTLDASFSGASGPFCVAVGSCGASGRLSLSLGPLPRTLTLQAFRPVPRRVGARQVIADLRRGWLGAPSGVLRPKARGLPARVSETFTGADGARCQAGAGSHAAEIDVGGPLVPGPVRGVPVALFDPTDTGMWRTYCPGPVDSDIFGPRSLLARGSLTVAQLLRRHTVVAVTSQGRFAGFAYAGSWSGDLRLALTLVGVRARVERETL